MAQNLEREDKFHVELEMAKAPAMSVWKAVEEEVELLKKAELENEALQKEIRQLKLDNSTIKSAKAKSEEEGTQVKLELEQAQANFVKEKNDLETAHQKQVDEMFFYGYRYHMRKHGITNDVPNLPSDDDDDTMLDGNNVMVEQDVPDDVVEEYDFSLFLCIRHFV